MDPARRGARVHRDVVRPELSKRAEAPAGHADHVSSFRGEYGSRNRTRYVTITFVVVERASSDRATRGEGTRARILDAAMALFAERGYQGTTVGDIEQAAGLAPRSGA